MIAEMLSVREIVSALMAWYLHWDLAALESALRDVRPVRLDTDECLTIATWGPVRLVKHSGRGDLYLVAAEGGQAVIVRECREFVRAWRDGTGGHTDCWVRGMEARLAELDRLEARCAKSGD